MIPGESAEARQHNEALAGELRVTRTERDLLKEQLNKFKRQLFAASSEVSGQHQKDMFFNEAEGLGAQAEPAAEEATPGDEAITHDMLSGEVEDGQAPACVIPEEAPANDELEEHQVTHAQFC